MKSFQVPEFYRSPIISKVKQFRKIQDPRKQQNTPTELNFGSIKYYLARHFGFCYGVENAIEIAFRAVVENRGKRIYLLSEMIHNPKVNEDLNTHGVKFLHDTLGNELIPLESVNSEDIVIIPAFGAPLQLIEKLNERNIETKTYNTTCPFVERVWKKSEQIGKEDHTIIIHGKYNHEETRSTFSRSEMDSEAVIVVRDLEEVSKLKEYISGVKTQLEFEKEFAGKFSTGFDIKTHFDKVGVINQTTMLATETEEISDVFRNILEEKFGKENIKHHFADTRDTLCYATKENQDATYGLLDVNADLAIVVGGYNSSNTLHIVELLEKKIPTYFISSANEIRDKNLVSHYNYSQNKLIETSDYLPNKSPLKIILTSGASCPDSMLDAVIQKINSFYNNLFSIEDVIKSLKEKVC